MIRGTGDQRRPEAHEHAGQNFQAGLESTLGYPLMQAKRRPRDTNARDATPAVQATKLQNSLTSVCGGLAQAENCSDDFQPVCNVNVYPSFTQSRLTNDEVQDQ